MAGLFLGSSGSLWNQEAWGGGSPACESQAVELLPGARFRIPVQNQAGALGSGLLGRDPPASVSGFPDPPAGISSSGPQFIWVPLPERYPGISALGLNRSRSCSRREKLEAVASWQRGQRGQPSQRLPPVQPVRRWSGFPLQGLGRQGLPAGDGSQSGRLRGARDFDSRLAGNPRPFQSVRAEGLGGLPC